MANITLQARKSYEEQGLRLVLDKLTPKHINSTADPADGACPTCAAPVDAEYFFGDKNEIYVQGNYCPTCGQALDWGC